MHVLAMLAGEPLIALVCVLAAISCVVKCAAVWHALRPTPPVWTVGAQAPATGTGCKDDGSEERG